MSGGKNSIAVVTIDNKMAVGTRPAILFAALVAALAAAAAASSDSAAATCSAGGDCAAAAEQPLILIASATATTGLATARALAARAGGARVRAMVRKMQDPRAVALGALAGVEVVLGDFDNATTIRSALVGVSRCLLVSGAFAYEQFERETLFLEAAAAAGVEVTVRIGTASALTKPGTKGAYGRAHHGIEAFIASMNYKVVTLNPNW